MIQPKNETQDILLSFPENCEMLVKEIHRKPQEVLQFKLNKPRQTFHFNPPVQIKEGWMIGLLGLEVYNSIFFKKEEKYNFELNRTSLRWTFMYCIER